MSPRRPRSDLPGEDVYVLDGRMSATIDISRFLDIRHDDIELVLSSGGEVLQLMRKTQSLHSSDSFCPRQRTRLASGTSTTAS
ncbi:MAG: hypothetical protein Ct9H300mP30_2330 [Methanobacteriota archaeon]|nr:MAG: hypothetical protein Ct9H300mP30_2330 [Euryarchaeota archaeon]